jgi:hypothetical protein
VCLVIHTCSLAVTDEACLSLAVCRGRHTPDTQQRLALLLAQDSCAGLCEEEEEAEALTPKQRASTQQQDQAARTAPRDRPSIAAPFPFQP